MIYVYTDVTAPRSGRKLGPGSFRVKVTEDHSNFLQIYEEKSDETDGERESLKAVLWAMLNIGNKEDDPPVVYTKSSYCVAMFNHWMFDLADRGWKEADGTVPNNLDLIQEYFNHDCAGYSIELIREGF